MFHVGLSHAYITRLYSEYDDIMYLIVLVLFSVIVTVGHTFCSSKLMTEYSFLTHKRKYNIMT